MAELRTANYAVTAINGSVGLTDTTITLVDASILPSLPDVGDYCFLTLIRAVDGAREIVQVDAISGNDITVQRGMDGTSALAFTSGDAAHMWLNSGVIDYLKSISGDFNPGLTKYQSIYTDATTAITVTDAQSAGLIRCTSDDPVTVTIPAGLTQGWMGAIEQAGLGAVTIVPDVGVTFSDTGSVTTVEQGSLISMLHTGSDEWNFAGEMLAAPIVGSIETIDRVINVLAGSDYATIQSQFNSVGGYIQSGVSINIRFASGVYDIGANILRVPDFGGGGRLVIQAEVATGSNNPTKNVTIRGSGLNARSDFPPYSTGQDDRRYLIGTENCNLVIFGDIKFEMTGSVSTVANSNVLIGFSQSSFIDCAFSNDSTTGADNFAIEIRNGGITTCTGCDVVMTAGGTDVAAVGCVSPGSTALVKNLSGSGDHAYHVNNGGAITYQSNTFVASDTVEDIVLGTIVT